MQAIKTQAKEWTCHPTFQNPFSCHAGEFTQPIAAVAATAAATAAASKKRI